MIPQKEGNLPNLRPWSASSTISGSIESHPSMMAMRALVPMRVTVRTRIATIAIHSFVLSHLLQLFLLSGLDLRIDHCSLARLVAVHFCLFLNVNLSCLS